MFIIVCSKCGKKSKPQKDCYMKDDWQSIRLVGPLQHDYHLCPECCEALKIPPTTDRTRNQTVGEALVEILTEIVENSVSDFTG